MSKVVALTGNEAAAWAMRQIEPDVVAAYPITPQTEIVMNFSQFVADGLVGTELIPVESEHSAMSACCGAAAAGARTMTATCANGLALMWEVLYIASGNRLPIVMVVVNRALSAPINIHCDHSDSMGARDSGWIQIYCENGQEVYESLIMAVRIAEHEKVLLPVMVCQDGFITGHAVEGIRLFEDGEIKGFIGERKPHFPLLDVERPVTYGPLDLQDYYFEHKRQQAEAMSQSKGVIPQVFAEFERLSGTKFGFIENYRLDDAEIAILALSSTCGTTRVVVDKLREKGLKVGLIKLRVFRPFPAEEIVSTSSRLKAVAILDRSESFSNQGGPVFNEVRSAFYEVPQKPLITNYIYGLGGRDMDTNQIESIYHSLSEVVKRNKVERPVNYIGVRE